MHFWYAPCMHSQAATPQHTLTLDTTLCPTPPLPQVRRPLYATSRGRWERYASHLQPLRRALGGLVGEYEARLEQVMAGYGAGAGGGEGGGAKAGVLGQQGNGGRSQGERGGGGGEIGGVRRGGEGGGHGEL